MLFSHAYFYTLVLVYSVKYISYYGLPQSSEVIELRLLKGKFFNLQPRV